MNAFRFLALTALLALQPLSLHAQPTANEPAATSDASTQAHALASQFLDQMHADQMALSALLGPGRIAVIAFLQRSSMTEEGAGQVFDQFMAPEFKARLPELRARMVDILVGDFTVPELQSIVANRQDDARRSAAAKSGQLQGQFQQAGQAWGQQIGADVFRQNADAIMALGFKPQATGK